MSDDLLLDEFQIPGEGKNAPTAIYARLVATCEEFEHIREGEPLVQILFRTVPKVKGGRAVLGECCMPTLQGSLRNLFEWLMVQAFGYMPDFLVILDREFWEETDDTGREALMFHEIMHIEQATDQHGAPRFNKETGRPIFRIRGHDLEEFNAVVRRYGAWSPDIAAFIRAVEG